MTQRKRRVAVALVIVLGGFGAAVRPFLFRAELPVVSIKTEPAYQDAALLERAWALPVARTYREQHLLSQPNVTVCGPTSAANVMRSLGTAGETVDAVLADSGHCPLGVCWGGLTLDELADLVRKKTGKRVTVLRDLSPAAFREHLLRTNDAGRRYIINFDRGPLFGPRGGHHSPLGGYLEGSDLAFVLDVNAKYQPWLVSSARLYAAMDTVDSSSGKKRGLLLIE
ncbi:MAG TPA: phytochelatin synthase family protein [Polyangia bacterium]|jgi:hypothetical protein|nr:phytochelatin synthase family protein [Polyangia bacterium]